MQEYKIINLEIKKIFDVALENARKKESIEKESSNDS